MQASEKAAFWEQGYLIFGGLLAWEARKLSSRDILSRGSHAYCIRLSSVEMIPLCRLTAQCSLRYVFEIFKERLREVGCEKTWFRV